MFIKKILILKSDNGKNSGVLRLTANGQEIEGALTLNFPISSPLSLILNLGETHEVSVLENESKFKLNTDFCGEAHCLLIENETPILSGSTNNDLRKLSELQNNYIEKKSKLKSAEKNQYAGEIKDKNSQQANKIKDEESRNSREIKNEKKYEAKPLSEESEKDKNTQNEKNQHKFKDKVMAQSSEPSAVINEGISYEGENFYIAVKPQLDEMFECYPCEERLEELISNSRWVRVDCDEEYYVVGLILDEAQKPEFICYGIPGTYPVKPPEEILDVCEWFPLDIENKYGDGFWLIYQNALNGKCLKNIDA